MALDISSDNALMWKAGIDLSDFDRALREIGQKIQTSVRGQLAQQQEGFKDIRVSALAASHSVDRMGDSIRDALGAGTLARVDALASRMHSLQAAVSAAGGGVRPMNTAGVDGLVKKLQDLRAMKPIDIPISFDEGELERIQRAFQGIAAQAKGSLNEKVATLEKMKQQYAALSDIDRRSSMGKKLADNIRGADRELSKINREIQRTESLAQRAGTALGAYLSLQAIGNFVSDMVRVRGEFQKLEAVLTNTLGNQGAAQQQLGMLADFAAKTPFQLTELGGAYVKLVNQGIKPARHELEALGDVAAATGKGFDQLAEAIIDAQTGEFERLKEFGIRAQKEGDKVAFTFKGVKTQVDFTAQSIKDYIVSLGQLEGVHGATAAISKTLEGQISNLKDSWASMLNELGKANEGVLNAGISSIKFLIDNYETVIDTVKVLALTYGSYRAALVLTNVASAALGTTTKSLTALQIIQTAVTTGTQRAVLLLNRTLLANPFVAVAAGVTALISAFVLFRREAEKTKTAADYMAEAQKQVADRLSETEAKIRPYLTALKDANLSEGERLKIYNELKAIDPKIVEGLNAKTLSYQTLTANVNKYLGALRNQIALEANKQAVVTSIQDEKKVGRNVDALRKQYREVSKMIDDLNAKGRKTEANALITKQIQVFNELVKANGQYVNQLNITQELGQQGLQLAEDITSQQSQQTKNTVDAIDKKIAALKQEQSAVSETSAKWAEYDRQIREQQRKRDAITGGSAGSGRGTAASIQKRDEGEINSLLSARKALLEQINNLSGDVRQSGLVREQSELDKIQEKYKAILASVEDYNRKVDAHNQRSKTRIDRIGTEAVRQIEAARARELSNTEQKQLAQAYLQTLEGQRELFLQFEESKKQIGIEKAREMYREQLKGFDDYIAYLESEASKVAIPIAMGIGSIGDVMRLKGITDALKKARAEGTAADRREVEETLRLLITAQDRRTAIEEQFNARKKGLDAAAAKGMVDNYAAAYAQLERLRADDLQGLENDLARSSDLYKSLGEDVITFSEDKLRGKLKELQKTLKQGTDLTPEMRAAIKQRIDQLVQLIASTNKATERALKTADTFTAVGEGISTLVSAMGDVNGVLGETLKVLAQVSSGIGSLIKNIEAMKVAEMQQSAAGMITAGAGIIGAAAGVFMAIDGLFEKRERQKIEARRRELAFQIEVLQREQAVTAEYRERAREQIRLNKLRLDGIRDENALLGAQKDAIARQAAQLMAEIAKLGRLAQTDEERMIQARDRQFGGMDPRFSLMGKSFEELEELYMRGLLEGKAKAIFEELQKLKQEGADIDRILEENKRAAAEMFTGIQFDTIVDQIAQMFREGKTSAADFAKFFEEKMGDAALSIFKNKEIARQMELFYEKFSEAAQSGEQLTAQEIEDLRQMFNDSMEALSKKFEQLKQVTGIDINNPQAASSGANSYADAIKGITAQQAELLAAQWGAHRVIAIQHLDVGRQQLVVQQRIEANTANMVREQIELTRIIKYYFENGVRVL